VSMSVAVHVVRLSCSDHSKRCGGNYVPNLHGRLELATLLWKSLITFPDVSHCGSK